MMRLSIQSMVSEIFKPSCRSRGNPVDYYVRKHEFEKLFCFEDKDESGWLGKVKLKRKV